MNARNGRAGAPARRSPLAVPALLLAALAVAGAGAPAATAQDVRTVGGDPGLERLGAEIARIAEHARGTVGVAAVHVQSGRAVYVNADQVYPMASTYKVPIAVQLLTLVDRGEIDLDDKVAIEAEDLYRTASAISQHIDVGAELTVRNLLELMIQISDNIATDLLLEMAGGGAAVTARMRELGLEPIRVDRPTWAVISAFRGRPDVTEQNRIYPDEYLRLLREEQTPEQRQRIIDAFNRDPRDKASPAAMAELLVGLWNETLLSPESSRLLLDIMYGTTTGDARLSGMLPPGTRVAHKTGTIGETTNDAGIIELPAGAGNVATVVYIKESKLPSNEAMEPIIAQIARSVHDYFLFNRGTGARAEGR